MATIPKEARALPGGAAGAAARDDARLVAALRAGDEDAFARLVTDYQAAIYSLAWRLVHDREDARDIAQEVFLKAYRQIPRIDGELHLWAWLYRVTVNACWDHLRAGSRRPVSLEERGEEADLAVGDGEDQAEMARLFAASLAELPPKQQAALLLKDVHGLQHRDVAEALGISRGSSEVLLFRARRSFRTAFTAMTADATRGSVCRFAEQAAAYSVGGRLTEARRRRVLEHARTCPDCCRTVEGWSGLHAVGLGLALPLVAAPPLFGAHVVASAATNLAAAAGASAAGVSAAASVALTSGASSVAGGLAAKLAGLGVAKAAVIALAATTVLTCGGAVAYKDYAKDGGRRSPVAPAGAAAVAGSGARSASSRPAAAGPVADALAVAGRALVAGDRVRPRLSGAGGFLAPGARHARGLLARALDLGRAARGALPAARRLPRGSRRFSSRPAGTRRPGARLPGVPAPGSRTAAGPGRASPPPAAQAARRSEAASPRPGAGAAFLGAVVRPAGARPAAWAGVRHPGPPVRRLDHRGGT